MSDRMTRLGRPAPRLLAAALLLAAAAPARADCPAGQQAACALHEEGVALLTAGKYAQAATKFRAALAAAPAARSYLGYAQALEGQGKLALAYEQMVLAEELSDEELERDGKDPVIIGRAERIKYKLNELGAQVAFATLRLPTGVAPRRLLSVHRDGEGDLEDPLGRKIAVAPGRQVLIAVLDDGSRLEVVAQIAVGAQGNVVLPIPADTARGARPGQPPRRQPPVGVHRERPAAPGARDAVIALDLAAVVPNLGSVAAGVGPVALGELRLLAPIAISARLGYLVHPEARFAEQGVAFSGRELLAMLGLRTRRPRAVYASVEVGLLRYTRTATALPMADQLALVDEYGQLHTAFAIGGGARLGRAHLEIGAVIALPAGTLDIPARLMTTLGFDLVRR